MFRLAGIAIGIGADAAIRPHPPGTVVGEALAEAGESIGMRRGEQPAGIVVAVVEVALLVLRHAALQIGGGVPPINLYHLLS